MTERSSTLIDNEFFDLLPKPQTVCPGCGYRHAGAGRICDVCANPNKLDLASTIGKPLIDATTYPLASTSPLAETVIPPETPALPFLIDSDSDCVSQPSEMPQEEVPCPAAPPLAQPAYPFVIHSASGLASSLPVSLNETPQAKATHRQSCRVCVHPECQAIDQVLLDNSDSQRNLAKHYQVTPRQISNHRLNHLKLPAQTRQEAARRGGQVAAALTGCKVCRHPAVELINAKIKSGVPAAVIKREYKGSVVPISDKVIATHRRKCLDIAEALPRGNRSGNPRGLQAVALRAQAAQEFPMSFTDHVAAEIRRLVGERERLTTELATLADQQILIERQYMALRAFQEADKGKDGSDV